ncbi:MAG: hypothetical protein F4Z08_11360 [Chloroflexi bacterium]|nr:hypothetical protein [Chloroflexota bacterium]
MNAHGQSGGEQIAALTDDFIDDFAIIGAPGYCAGRLTELEEIGVTKFVIVGPNSGVPTARAGAAAARFADDVLPLLRT